MDLKVSRKESRFQPDGPVMVLMDNIFDLYLIYGNDERAAGLDLFPNQDNLSPEELANLIVDVEILDNDRDELLDRAMTALVKQRGADPLEADDGIQWAEAVIGEVPQPMILQQVHNAVAEEGPGVRAVPSSVKANGRERLFWKIELTNAV
jgi:hypothetical protein